MYPKTQLLQNDVPPWITSITSHLPLGAIICYPHQLTIDQNIHYIMHINSMGHPMLIDNCLMFLRSRSKLLNYSSEFSSSFCISLIFSRQWQLSILQSISISSLTLEHEYSWLSRCWQYMLVLRYWNKYLSDLAGLAISICSITMSSEIRSNISDRFCQKKGTVKLNLQITYTIVTCLKIQFEIEICHMPKQNSNTSHDPK